MRVLNISLDREILNSNSRVSARIAEYGNLVEYLCLVIPYSDDIKVDISDRVKAYGVKATNKVFGFFKIFFFLKRLLEQEAFDVVTVQDPYFFSIFGLYFSRTRKMGFELQIHGLEKFYGIRKIIAGLVIPRAHAIRVVSTRLKNMMINDYGVDEHKISVLPVYVEINAKQEPRTRRQGSPFIFLTVGRLVPIKNIGMQIRAMQRICKLFKDAELWVLGDGPERRSLESLAFRLGLERSVRFLGWQSDVDKYYREVDVFLLTSYSEGWPLVIMEAAKHSLPVIMTDVGSAGELVIDGKSGIVIPVGDQSALETAMIRIIEDYFLAVSYGQALFDSFSSLPTKEMILDAYLANWKRAMNKV